MGESVRMNARASGPTQGELPQTPFMKRRVVRLVGVLMILGIIYYSLFVVLPRLGAVNNAAILNIEPLVALAMAWLVLDQRIAPVQIAGGAVVIAAIIVLSTGRR